MAAFATHILPSWTGGEAVCAKRTQQRSDDRSLEYELKSCSPSAGQSSYLVGNQFEIVCISGLPANGSDFRASRVNLAEQSILRGLKLDTVADCD